MQQSSRNPWVRDSWPSLLEAARTYNRMDFHYVPSKYFDAMKFVFPDGILFCQDKKKKSSLWISLQVSKEISKDSWGLLECHSSNSLQYYINISFRDNINQHLISRDPVYDKIFFSALFKKCFAGTFLKASPQKKYELTFLKQEFKILWAKSSFF